MYQGGSRVHLRHSYSRSLHRISSSWKYNHPLCYQRDTGTGPRCKRLSSVTAAAVPNGKCAFHRSDHDSAERHHRLGQLSDNFPMDSAKYCTRGLAESPELLTQTQFIEINVLF